MVLCPSTVKAQLCAAENREKPCFEHCACKQMKIVGLHHCKSGTGFSSGCFEVAR